MDVCVGYCSLSVVFQNIDGGAQWLFSEVYDPNDDSRRRLLCDELVGVISWWNVPWCIGRDFNVTRFPSERWGFGVSGRGMKEFSDFISKFGLENLSSSGGLFTWSNNRSSQSWFD